MKKVTGLRSQNLRQDRNTELVRRMRTGEQLTSFNSYSSWFPPRPIIEKDEGAIRKLYGKAATALQSQSVTNAPQKDAEPATLQLAN